MSANDEKKKEEGAQVDDIYGDLNVVAQTVAAHRASIEERYEEMEKRNARLEAEVAGLKNQGRVWAKQRSVLVHNLGALLKTAETEMARKDAEIKRLRQEVSMYTSQVTQAKQKSQVPRIVKTEREREPERGLMASLREQERSPVVSDGRKRGRNERTAESPDDGQRGREMSRCMSMSRYNDVRARSEAMTRPRPGLRPGLRPGSGIIKATHRRMRSPTRRPDVGQHLYARSHSDDGLSSRKDAT